MTGWERLGIGICRKVSYAGLTAGQPTLITGPRAGGSQYEELLYDH
jgi:hypothetical protein